MKNLLPRETVVVFSTYLLADQAARELAEAYMTEFYPKVFVRIHDKARRRIHIQADKTREKTGDVFLYTIPET